MEFILVFLTGFIVAITPGPDILFITRNTLQYGIKIGLYSIFGVFSGCSIFALLVYFGLTKTLSKDIFQFTLSAIGGIYLIYLAISLLKNKNNINLTRYATKYNNYYLKGLLINLSNPKAILFFAIIVTPFTDKYLELNLVSLLFGNLSAFCSALIFSAYFRKFLTNDLFSKIDKISAIVFAIFGISLLYSAICMLDNTLLLE